jgi:hypothetical protein
MVADALLINKTRLCALDDTSSTRVGHVGLAVGPTRISRSNTSTSVQDAAHHLFQPLPCIARYCAILHIQALIRAAIFNVPSMCWSAIGPGRECRCTREPMRISEFYSSSVQCTCQNKTKKLIDIFRKGKIPVFAFLDAHNHIYYKVTVHMNT